MVGVGVGVALVLTSGLGANSWDVLGVALAALTGLPLTVVFLAVGVVNLSGAMLLGRHPGPATLVPTLIYGPVIEVSLRLLPDLTIGLAFAIPAATDALPAVRVRTPAAPGRCRRRGLIRAGGRLERADDWNVPCPCSIIPSPPSTATPARSNRTVARCSSS